MSVSAPTPEVPSDWEIAKTGKVCEVENGYAFKSEFFNDKNLGLPLIRIRDVHSGRSDTFYSGPFDEKYVVTDDDLLIGMDGEFRVRKWRSGKGLLNQRVCRLVPNGGPMIADFLYYSIGRPLKQIEAFTPFTTVKRISAGQIRAIELPLPPLPEQKKIAHILSTVQRAIEAQERIIQTTTELKKALMHKFFTEGLRNEPQKQTEIGPVPESWGVVELGSLAKVGNGSTPKRANDAYWEEGTIPWLNSTKIHDRFITEADQFVTPQAVKECHLPKVAPNSLLIAITGQGKTLGNSAITRIETCINQHLAYAQFHSEKIIPD
ncbi:MAG: restriction endonuclease subunit S, partial [Burkholderiales bacterium]